MQKRSNILVVDDEPSNVQILAEGLSDDYDITVAKSGLEGFNNALNFQPDLILLDIGLPDIDGYEVCKLLKNHDATREIPIIFVTARDDDDDELTGLTLGAVDYVRKPFCMSLVKARISNQLELRQKTKLLADLAMLDGLTAIPNRRHFEVEFEKSWRFAQRKQRPLSIAIIDIDYFKQYNDIYGHLQGDKCLQTVAKKISDSLVRPMDFVARYGGEEFVVILLDSDLDSTINVAEKIRTGIESLCLKHEHPTTNSWLTVSIGVATMVPQQGDNHKELLLQADKNLYHAKSMGRNCSAQA